MDRHSAEQAKVVHVHLEILATNTLGLKKTKLAVVARGSLSLP